MKARRLHDAGTGKVADTIQDQHYPVLVQEVLELMGCRDGGFYVDCTVGSAGHSEAILKASGPGGRLVAIDKDPEALTRSKERLKGFGDRVQFVHRDFREWDAIQEDAGFSEADGILMDLGVSSCQLQSSQRGFSIEHDGPLDMRMNTEQELTASHIVNEFSESELEQILREFGEERRARFVARKIVEERKKKPIETTRELAAIVTRGVRPRNWQRIHPATRSFQAIRIATNSELEALDACIERAADNLSVGGTLCVISFHSLEDRIAKWTFRAMAKEKQFEILTKKPVMAGEEERSENRRSRSAKLRALRRPAGSC